jgi:hypothetical protein
MVPTNHFELKEFKYDLRKEGNFRIVRSWFQKLSMAISARHRNAHP